ncbi:cytochrome P450 [Pontibacter silvestris]|uniref:Cytochrome P450 n=1 Tax=Pontibacter silvestris TaxID=2305183 RepID=A0ABW4WX29_9BACT|nr:cytochrome P450 [Pontibacter silvestris]MCC9137420.1 cytochrome P450 [Pontibacter silvestris]
MTTPIPRDKDLDSTLKLLLNGYPLLQEKFRHYDSDIFRTRFLGQKAVCIHGQEAAEIFYNPELFERKNAIPKRIQKTLMGENGIQTMDGPEHRRRKELFMSLMTQENINNLMSIMADEWQTSIYKWEEMDEVVLYKEVQDLICRAACAWADVPLKESKVRRRAADFGYMVDAFGAVGPRHWRGKRARSRGEKWIGKVIKDIRKGKLEVREGTAAHAMAWHRDINGELLDIHMATVELMNVLRPIVAIARYVTFAAIALHQYPVHRQILKEDEDNYAELFVQEVRRFYPFTPVLGAHVRTDFEWQNYHFKKGTMVLLDVYGTLHDERLWERPNAFSPERFRDWDGSPFDFIPQGGGDYMTGHRCAGEWITIEAMKVAVNYLTKAMEYRVPNQDLDMSLSRMPTIPVSRFIISQVRATADKPSLDSAGVVGATTSKAAKCPFHQ